MVTTYDIVVIGGGIIGENIVYALKSHTDNIAIIDDAHGYKATHAAGGMLGAQNEFTEDSPLYRLSVLGQQMMPDHIQQLENLTGLSIDLQQHGLLKIASPGDEENLKTQYDFLNSKHEQFEWIASKALSSYANGSINNAFEQAMWIPTDGQVNAGKYLTVIKYANQDIPHISDHVKSINYVDDKYHLSISDKTIISDKVVIAAGCKSEDLLNMLDIDFPMQGVKGEVLTLHHPDLYLKETLFQTNGHYIVPKSDNHYLIGATTSLDTKQQPSAEGVKWLLEETFKLIPKLCDSTIVSIDCGFRPDTTLHRPVLDQLDEGLFLATGHYRNGILLSRITGEFMRQMIFEQDGELYQQFQKDFKIGEIYENIH